MPRSHYLWRGTVEHNKMCEECEEYRVALKQAINLLELSEDPFYRAQEILIHAMH